MYRLGFCVYGPNCRYRHDPLPGPPPPAETVEAARPRPRYGQDFNSFGRGRGRYRLTQLHSLHSQPVEGFCPLMTCIMTFARNPKQGAPGNQVLIAWKCLSYAVQLGPSEIPDNCHSTHGLQIAPFAASHDYVPELKPRPAATHRCCAALCCAVGVTIARPANASSSCSKA